MVAAVHFVSPSVILRPFVVDWALKIKYLYTHSNICSRQEQEQTGMIYIIIYKPSRPLKEKWLLEQITILMPRDWKTTTTTTTTTRGAPPAYLHSSTREEARCHQRNCQFIFPSSFPARLSSYIFSFLFIRAPRSEAATNDHSSPLWCTKRPALFFVTPIACERRTAWWEWVQRTKW